MAYNPAMYFPQSYQPQMYQPPSQQQPQGRMVDIIPADSEAAAEAFPVAVGATQLMIARDDSFIAVKVNGMNGQSSLTFYDKRPPAPTAPVFDPTEYQRKDEAEKLVEGLLAAHTAKEKEAPKG